MNAILISYTRKDNIILNRVLRASFAAAVLLVIFVSNGFSQTGWSSPLHRCWTYESPSLPSTPLASDNEYIFFSTSSDTIIAINQSSGEVIWEADLSGNLGSDLYVGSGKLTTTILSGKDNFAQVTSLFRQIDSGTGVPFVTRILGTSALAESTVMNGDNIYIGTQDGLIEKLDSNGELVWQNRLLTEILSDIVVEKNRILLGSGNKSIISLDESTGSLLAQINISGLPIVLTGHNGRIYAGDSIGRVYSFDNGLSQSWMAKTGAGISAIDFYDGDLLVSSKDNFVYRLNSSDGDRVWKRKLAGRILGGVQIDENHAVFLTSGATIAVILDLRDGSYSNKFEAGERFVSGPVKTQNGFAIPTENALIAVSNQPCGKEKGPQ